MGRGYGTMHPPEEPSSPRQKIGHRWSESFSYGQYQKEILAVVVLLALDPVWHRRSRKAIQDHIKADEATVNAVLEQCSGILTVYEDGEDEAKDLCALRLRESQTVELIEFRKAQDVHGYYVKKVEEGDWDKIVTYDQATNTWIFKEGKDKDHKFLHVPLTTDQVQLLVDYVQKNVDTETSNNQIICTTLSTLAVSILSLALQLPCLA